MRAIVAVVSALAAFGNFTPLLVAAQIYWSDLNGMHRASLDGTNVQTLNKSDYAETLRLDIDAALAYWTSGKTNAIWRTGLDGAEAASIVPANGPRGLAIEPAAGLMYWTEPETTALARGTLDGASAVKLIQTPPFEYSIMGTAVDSGSGAVFWSEVGNVGAGRIWKGDRDGKNAAVIFSSDEGGPTSLLLDEVGGWLYWASQPDDVGRGADIQRARLDGSSVETLFEFGEGSGARALDIALDPFEGKLYWSQGNSLSGSIWSIGLDGSNPALLFDVGAWPTGLALDSSLPGDANGDRSVDLEDFGVLKSNFGFGTRRSQGDFNADHQVDLSDFGILKANFGEPPAAAAPEPPAGLLFALGALMSCWGGRRFAGGVRRTGCP